MDSRGTYYCPPQNGIEAGASCFTATGFHIAVSEISRKDPARKGDRISRRISEIHIYILVKLMITRPSELSYSDVARVARFV